MTPNVEQFGQSDVKFAGFAALACVGLAFFAANVSGMIPSSTLTMLHVARNDVVTVSQLRQQLSELRTDTAQLRREADVLNARFSLQEHWGNDVIRRVGALEVSMPTLQELQPVISAVDRSATTASIGESSRQISADGSLAVRQSPMPENVAQQPLPPAIAPAVASASGATLGYGVAIGPAFAPGQGTGQWRDLEIRLGSLLSNMQPLLTDEASGSNQRLVAGPLAQMTEARDFCQRLEKMEISCTPTIYSGTALK